MPDDGLLTPQDLAERWQVPASHVYKLARNGLIPVVRLGKYARFRTDTIAAWERAATEGPNATDADLRWEATRYREALLHIAKGIPPYGVQGDEWTVVVAKRALADQSDRLPRGI